ncbi:MAG: exopolyphosphatase, partial [Pseudomonadota bacterium]|nr:exopolyphosphatase [Pseudomonadota bacterium]
MRTEKFADALNRLGTLRPDAPLGVLDIGSNSVRLVGYSGSARTPLPIYNERAFCRLGEAVSATGRIEGEPYKLALMTLQRFRAIAERLGIVNLAAFATAA